jgi:hypothetical protein
MGKRASGGRDSSPPTWHAHGLRSCFIVAATCILICHFCVKTRLMRQPWNMSLSGYNISKLPRSRARRIAMSGRGSAVQDTEWRLNTLKSFGPPLYLRLINILWDCVVGPVCFRLSLFQSFGHYILDLQLDYVMGSNNRSVSVEWAHFERDMRLCPVSKYRCWSQSFGLEIDT